MFALAAFPHIVGRWGPSCSIRVLMKMQGNRKQVQSRLTFPTALLGVTMRHLSTIFSESNEWRSGVCPSLRPRYQPDASRLVSVQW